MPFNAKLFSLSFAAVLGTVVLALAPSVVAAQTSSDANANRYPATGVPILDCAPALELLQDTCILRVPPAQERGALRASEVEGAKGDFKFVRPGSSSFPDGVTLSETIVLIDLSPGPQAQRRATFDTERAFIRQFVQSLPAGESIAVYGFKEEMVRLSDFSTTRANALDAIDAIELTGTNTRLSTFTKEAIGILGAREGTAIKNLFIVSDGDEEGDRDVAGVTQAAIAADVSVSAIGMFWRPIGAAQTGAGMDYLSSLTEGTSGSSVQVQLRRGDDARARLQGFQSNVAKSFQGSGLIVPDGEAKTSDIVVTMKRPTIGVSGAFTEEEIRVRFTPAGDGASDADVVEPVAEGNMIFGYPAMWVYGAAALLGLFLLGLLLALLRGRRGDTEEEVFTGDDGFEDFDPEEIAPAPVTPAVKPAPPPALAYLIDERSGKRMAMRSANATVGRSADSGVVIDDDSVSRSHAQISRVSDGGFRIVDLGSLNGTFLDGKKVTDKVVLATGNVIKFGEVEVRFVLA